MIHIERILCPVDFSEISRRALDHAVAIARWYDSKITALHVAFIANPVAGLSPLAGPVVLEPVGLSAIDRQRAAAELRRLVEAESAEGVSIDRVVVQGEPVQEILRQAESMSADMVVIGTHGRSGFERLVLGSVTEKVLRKAACPVMTVPPGTSGAVPVGPVLFNQILCPVDFSDSSLNALNHALSIAQEADAQMTVLHVLEVFPELRAPEYEPVYGPEYQVRLEEAARERLRQAIPDSARAYCRIEEVVSIGRSYREILKLAERQRSELIVMGVQGRGAVDLMLFGSTTQHVIRAATCPVLTVRMANRTVGNAA